MDLKRGSKHRSMAQWAKEAQQPCLLPSASITNREGKEKEGEGEGETSTPPTQFNSYKTAARDPFLLKNTRRQKILPDVQLLKTDDGFTLTGVNGNQNQQQITRKPLYSPFPEERLTSDDLDLQTKATILSPRNDIYIYTHTQFVLPRTL